MSTGAPGAVGPVSVRYAAQIQELLFAQAMQRMAAEQEAARASASAERQARSEATRAKDAEPINAKVDPPKPLATPAPVNAPEPRTDDGAGRFVDIQA